MKIGDTEATWRLPSPPIAETKHKDFLCKFKSVLIYTWIANPAVLPLQILGNTKNKNKILTFS